MSTLLLLVSLAFASAPADEPPAEVDAESPAVEDAAVEDEVLEEEPPWEPKFPGAPAPDWPHYDIEEIYEARDYDEGLKQTLKRIESNPDDADLYWLAARFMYEQGELIGRDDTSVDKEAHYEEMVRLADVGLQKRPGDLHLRFARGVGRGRLGTTRGVLSSLWMAADVEADWLAAANGNLVYSSINGTERLPCDAHHALGIYYRLVPDAWIVKVLAGVRGSLDKSLMHLEKANSCSPGRQHIQKELGVSRLCKGTKDKDDALIAKGKEILEKAAAHPGTTAKAKIDSKHAKMLIADPSMACGYSRDGQQETDSSKLEK